MGMGMVCAGCISLILIIGALDRLGGGVLMLHVDFKK